MERKRPLSLLSPYCMKPLDLSRISADSVCREMLDVMVKGVADIVVWWTSVIMTKAKAKGNNAEKRHTQHQNQVYPN
ncbi:hypothetical protein V6N13_099701 [Hibiscus sabdariffa]|uniref:Uncharacterized protein n=2 Tax=Hibiscus sabdariffa TaxID=183260 RepID=A0ABR2NMP3_9ROSI